MLSMQDDQMKALANDLNIAHLSEQEQQELLAQFGEVALKAATVAILEKLPADKRQDFASAAETGDATKVQEFLNKEVPDHESLAKAAIDAEVRRFKEFTASK